MLGEGRGAKGADGREKRERKGRNPQEKFIKASTLGTQIPILAPRLNEYVYVLCSLCFIVLLIHCFFSITF